ncbi:MAG: glycosyltransferase [Bacteroidales bacterium]|nr:glycosyltransferase [Bacteroidales bacterium]
MKILIIGPAYPLRGGIANFTERLALEFLKQKEQVEVLSFSLQYPGFLFPGKSQYTDKPRPELKIHTRINSVNPLNWIRCGFWIRKQKYDLIVFMYWLPFMAPALGTIARITGKKTQRIALLHNIIPHEKRFFDRLLSGYFVKSVDGFAALSQSVLDDLVMFDTKKPRAINPHPIYDNFGEITGKSLARRKLNLNPDYPLILFFGFIRKYKGLDLLLNAAKDDNIRQKNIQIVVAGEFYDDPMEYNKIIEDNNLKNVIFRNEFIADEEVGLYFSACDLVVQPYRDATQSGVTQIAFHFEKPMVVTNVGGLSEIVPHKKAGYVVDPKPDKIAGAINDFFDHNRQKVMIENVKTEKAKYSWDKLVDKIRFLYKQ